VSFYSDLLSAREVVKSRQLSHDLFCGGCRETVENIKLLRKRIRKDDSFDFGRFLSWLEHRVEQLPQTISDLTTIQSEIEVRRRAAWETLSVWDSPLKLSLIARNL
jgi:hypothetical protein